MKKQTDGNVWAIIFYKSQWRNLIDRIDGSFCMIMTLISNQQNHTFEIEDTVIQVNHRRITMTLEN